MRTLYARIGTALVALAATSAVTVAACNQGGEGNRCNPDLSQGHDECGGGLVCNANIPLCPEAYCCPPAADGGLGSSSNPNCQTGCAGGAASICNAGQTGSAEACAFACKNDPGDLTSASTGCASPDGGSDASEDGAAEGSSEGSSEAGGDSAPQETGSGDSATEAAMADGGAG
jgi:hypothetical protein